MCDAVFHPVVYESTSFISIRISEVNHRQRYPFVTFNLINRHIISLCYAINITDERHIVKSYLFLMIHAINLWIPKLHFESRAYVNKLG